MSENTSFFSDEDWEDLLPGKIITLGKKSIRVKPFGLEDFISVTKQLASLKARFIEQGVTRNNFQTDKLPEVASIVVSEVPNLASMASGIPVEDLLRLPLGPVIAIVGAIIEVNLESQKGLEKNLQGLVAGLAKLSSPNSLQEKPENVTKRKRK